MAAATATGLRGLRLTPSLTTPVATTRYLQQRTLIAFQQQRGYASRETQGKQILIRDHGVFGK